MATNSRSKNKQKEFVPNANLYPENVSEILDVNKIFDSIENGFSYIGVIISELSSLLKSRDILNSSVFEQQDIINQNYINIVKKLVNSKLRAELESVFYNIYKIQIITTIKKIGIEFPYDLDKLNDNIANVKLIVAQINRDVERLTSLPWWNTLQQSNLHENPDFKIQVLYCGIADACTRFLEAVKMFKESEGSDNSKIELDEKDSPILNLAPPLVQEAAKAYYDEKFSRAKECRN